MPKKTLYISFLCLGILIPASLVQAQDFTRLTLQDCLDLALKNNLQLQADKEKKQGAQAKKGQALSLFFPTLEAEAGYTLLDKDRTSSLTLPDQYYNAFLMNNMYFNMKRSIERGELQSWGYGPGTDPFVFIDILDDPSKLLSLPPELQAKLLGYYADAKAALPKTIQSGYLGCHALGASLSLTQPLFTGGKILGRFQQASWNTELAAAQETAAQQEVLFQVCQLYFALSQSRGLLDLADEMQSRFKMLEIITKAMMSNQKSRKTQYDYMTIRVYANKIELLKKQAGTEAAKGRLALQLLVGSDQTVDVLGNSRLPQVAVAGWEDSRQQLENNNPTWKQFSWVEKISEQEVAIAREELWPNLGATGKIQYFHEEPAYGYMPETSWQVGVGAQWRFPLGMQTIEAWKEKRTEHTAAVFRLEFARRAMAQKLRSLLLELQSLQEQYQFMQQALADARERSTLAIEGYRIEEVGTREVIEAQTEESETRIQYFEILKKYQSQLAEYLMLTGGDLHAMRFEE